ncbi:hypothetical protein AB0383_20425 [Amycolatopsis sp. NPDC051373]|uniref:hypothetical protein n=1 Tax=Amycolatopsis sp. NPDC051373 TaxID=3155801 RepID=UPI00344D56F4
MAQTETDIVRSLTETFRPVRQGCEMPGYDGPGMYLKVRYRQPFCVKLAAMVWVENVEVAGNAAQRFSNMIGLPLDIQVFDNSPDADDPTGRFAFPAQLRVVPTGPAHADDR